MPEKKKTKAKAEERITEEIKETPKQPPYKVLFLASECVPFVKTGGLADVIGALPKELKRQGADVRVMIPLYSAIGKVSGTDDAHMRVLCTARLAQPVLRHTVYGVSGSAGIFHR